MLTVKHISEFGFEQVFSATDVTTRSREYPVATDAAVQDSGRPNFIVDCKRGATDSETFRDGQIYVMNENGKTVASYDLRMSAGAAVLGCAGGLVGKPIQGLRQY